MTRKKMILYAVLSLLLITAVSFAIYTANKSSKTPDVNSSQEEQINFNPPTNEDAQRVENNKKAIEKKDAEIEQRSDAPSSTPKAAKPIITYAGQYGSQIEVGAYVNDVYEDGGVCTAEFTKEATKFTRNVQAVKSAKSTDCPVVIVNVQDFPQKGTWNVVVSYKSSSAVGVSEARAVDVK